MKKLYITVITILAVAFTAAAQPRAVGLKVGAVAEASYQHSIKGADSFVEVDLGLDYLNGTLKNHGMMPGAKATATLNMIIGHPQWGGTNDWNFYVGPGISMGYVGDTASYKYDIPTDDRDYTLIERSAMGIMASLVFQVGIEYNFAFPLQISCDIRPMFGLHAARGYDHPTYGAAKGGLGFYDSGAYGFIPSISVRYRF